MSLINIGGHQVGPRHPVYCIAEIGINHNGSVEEALKLIDAAHAAGADAVKFQKRDVPAVYAVDYDKPRPVPRWFLEQTIRRGVLPKADLAFLKDIGFRVDASANPEETISVKTGIQKWGLEFTREEFAQIDAYCERLGILWSASAWDADSVDFLDGFDVPFHKVASAMLTYDDLLRRMRRSGKPVILSTGGSTMEQVRHAVDVLGRDNLVIMHCTAAYPSKMDEAALASINLDCMGVLRKEFPGIPIGFSSNDPDRIPTILAMGAGAVAVEKHLCLAHTLWGSDQANSAESHDLAFIFAAAQVWDAARGDGVKRVTSAEEAAMKKLRYHSQ